MPKSIKSLINRVYLLPGAIVDPKGFGFFQLMLENANVPQKYIIDEGIYKNIKYIVVETHERFFKDGKLKLKDLKNRIKDKNINNIYLDWI